nr:glycoside hydrolase family 104 protein [Acidovorax sp. SUPP2825]
MIAFAEGTAGRGDDGYNILFGGAEFEGYERHPRVYVAFGNTTSSAAGRYQFLARTWDGLAAKMGLQDFGPASQDAGALELIRERGALADVQAGRTVKAINKVAKVWASLPGAGYGQPERRLSVLLNAYARAGGISEVTTA